jgi:type II secretory pathway component GspD/PulD (secretin)
MQRFTVRPGAVLVVLAAFAVILETTSVALAGQPAQKIETIQLLHANAADAASVLKTSLDAAKRDVTIVVEPVSNNLILSIAAEAYDDVMPIVHKVVSAVDLQPALCQIELLIVEVRANHRQHLQKVLDGHDKCCVISSERCVDLIRDLQKQRGVQLISAPRIITADNQAARALVGQSVPYIKDNSGSDDYDLTLGFRDVGTQVQVVPKIAPNGKVVMRVVAEVTKPLPTNIELTKGGVATSFNVQSCETTVILKDGETAVIGGLIHTEDRDASTSQRRKGEQVETLFILTPHVLR